MAPFKQMTWAVTWAVTLYVTLEIVETLASRTVRRCHQPMVDRQRCEADPPAAALEESS
jgi:hypothetical protein